MKLSTVIMAAGQGTRMVSTLPKVLHPLNGKAMILYALETAKTIGAQRLVVVIGNGAEKVRDTLGDGIQCVIQEERLGTAHAVMMAEGELSKEDGLVLVTAGDMPLLTARTLESLVKRQEQNSGPFSMLTVRSNNPRGFGRVVRGPDGSIHAIVEEAQASAEQLLINELNVGAYCFRADWLCGALKKIKLSPKGEYYLTALVAMAVAEGKTVESILLDDEEEALGINNRVHLADAERILRRRVNEGWMMAGVTMIDPNLVYIGPEVKIGKDSILYPNTRLAGKTVIGEGCEIGPNTIIQDTVVGDHCHLLASVLEGAEVGNEVGMGPFCHLRKGARLGDRVHMGNFGEVKDSTLAAGVKMGHFSYIGNATIGTEVNIGAGTITCNFDGEHKHPTEIGEGAFIGSDTMLVAPLKIGKGAKTGAGSVVTHDVPDGEVVVGVPARKLRGN